MINKVFKSLIIYIFFTNTVTDILFLPRRLLPSTTLNYLGCSSLWSSGLTLIHYHVPSSVHYQSHGSSLSALMYTVSHQRNFWINVLVCSTAKITCEPIVDIFDYQTSNTADKALQRQAFIAIPTSASLKSLRRKGNSLLHQLQKN